MANLKYYAQKDALGFPIPGTLMATKGKVPANSIEIPAIVDPGSHPKGLKYYVRLDKSGKIIPNSLVTTVKKPRGIVAEFTEGAVASLLTEANESLVTESNELLAI